MDRESFKELANVEVRDRVLLILMLIALVGSGAVCCFICRIEVVKFIDIG